MADNNEIWVFLSHSNKDYEKVRRVRNILEDQSFRPLMFFLCCLEDDQEIDSLIKREIDHRSRFIYCESENAKASKWVQEEVKYIKSQDRIFETINIDLPESKIKEQLEGFRRKANIFILYYREDLDLARMIHHRLKKYEFKLWMDYYDLREGDFQNEIHRALLNAVNNGYVITILNEKILNPDSWTRAELKHTIRNREHFEQSIIPVVQDNYILEKLDEDDELRILGSISAINTSDVKYEQRSDFIVDEVIKRVLPPGAILLHAQNFMNGEYGFTDVDEAKRLYKMFFKLADDSDNPAALYAVGECYEFGYGVEINYDTAYNYYCECRRELGGKQQIGSSTLDEHCQRVYGKIHANSQ